MSSICYKAEQINDLLPKVKAQKSNMLKLAKPILFIVNFLENFISFSF